MAKKEMRMANINWSKMENRWVLRLADENGWKFSKAWGVRKEGEDSVTGEPLDWVSDSILCEIAHLQDLGYQVTVTA